MSAVDEVWIGTFIGTHLDAGDAVCPKCERIHRLCGLEHARRPWSMPPRCVDCSELLLLPKE